MRILPLAALVLWCTWPVAGQKLGDDERRLPDPGKGYKWEEAAAQIKMPTPDIDRLRADKLLITDQAFPQSFSPYINSILPIFITSDAVLNGYHVLFEESVLRLEEAQAHRLPAMLRAIAAGLTDAEKPFKGNGALAKAAKRRAIFVIAVALRLAGDDKTSAAAPDLEDAVKKECAKITAASGAGKPSIAAGEGNKSFPDLDYTRFRPRGFYASSPELQRYFRAVSWLQAIPFRVDNDEDLVAIIMLRNAVGSTADLKTFTEAWRRFLGAGDDLDLLAALRLTTGRGFFGDNVSRLDAGAFEGLRESARKLAESPQINDQLPSSSAEAPPEPLPLTFRVLSAHRTPDGVLFQRTTDPRKFQRPLPAPGLEIAAILGSSAARAELAESDESVVHEIDGAKVLVTFDRGESLYVQYLDCLAGLFVAPEKDVPALFTSKRWETKSRQTALGGWAQLRHTWALQAKEDVGVFASAHLPPGFVEPAPEFFGRLARLAEATDTALREAGAYQPHVHRLAADIREFCDLFEKLDFANKRLGAFRELPEAQRSKLSAIGNMAIDLIDRTKSEPEFTQELNALLPRLRSLADNLDKGLMPTDPRLMEALSELRTPLEPLWRECITTCHRLESLAHKQLRGVPLNAEELRFLSSFGPTLAHVMLYDSNSYFVPRDDAPRVVDIFQDAVGNRFLEVGIARPRALYVLYPTGAGEILCRGAVFPYHEFTSTSRLTDNQWISKLSAKDRPPLPTWAQSIYSKAGIDHENLSKHP